MAAAAKETSTFRVHDELRHEILEGTLAPGARLRAEALAQRLNTSRTPVREALMLLAREGLVEVVPRRGAVVSSFDPADLIDRYEVRAVIEPQVARRATGRIGPTALTRLAELCDLSEARGGASLAAVDDQIAFNEEFHRLIVDAAGSIPMRAALRAVGGVPLAFAAPLWNDERRLRNSQLCHRQLVEALNAGKPDIAEAVMRLHIVTAMDSLSEIVGSADSGTL